MPDYVNYMTADEIKIENYVRILLALESKNVPYIEKKYSERLGIHTSIVCPNHMFSMHPTTANLSQQPLTRESVELYGVDGVKGIDRVLGFIYRGYMPKPAGN